jgi:rhodanese-related sulfurtransferase
MGWVIAWAAVFVMAAGAVVADDADTSEAPPRGPQVKYPEIAAVTDSLLAKAARSIQVITPDELAELLDSGEAVTVLDVSTELEFGQGHIKGAVLLPRGKLEFFAPSGLIGAPDDRIVVYCKKGKRSVMSCHLLQILGFTDVRSLEGGLRGWVEAGYSIYNDLGEVAVKRFMAREED